MRLSRRWWTIILTCRIWITSRTILDRTECWVSRWTTRSRSTAYRCSRVHPCTITCCRMRWTVTRAHRQPSSSTWTSNIRTTWIWHKINMRCHRETTWDWDYQLIGINFHFNSFTLQITSSSTKKLWDNKSDIKNTGPLAPLQMPGNNEHQMWSKEHQGVWSKDQQMWSAQDNNSGMMHRRSDNTMPGILRWKLAKFFRKVNEL